MSMRSALPSNLHVRTSFCGGNGTPREAVDAAIDLGMEAVGFFLPSPAAFAPMASRTAEQISDYCREVNTLKREYADRIKILFGIEQDYCSRPLDLPCDYIVGSVRGICMDGEYCPIDANEAHFMTFIRRHCGGDITLFLREYYRCVADLESKTQCDMVGQLDLLARCSAKSPILDASDPYYRRFAMQALDVLLDKNVIFEINTDTVMRGLSRTPEPSPHLLRYIAMHGGEVTVCSDACRREQLRQGFELACRYAHSCGFSSVLCMTRNGWKRISI